MQFLDVELSITIVSLSIALVIDSDPHRLIDIQESPLLLCDHELGQVLPQTSRRHSLQDERRLLQSGGRNCFEIQFAQHTQHGASNRIRSHRRNETDIFRANAFNWLKNIDSMASKRLQYETLPQRRFKSILRRTSSENELLLISPTNDQLSETPAIRRSYSSGLLFSN